MSAHFYRGNRVAVILPCYNEGPAIGAVVKDFARALPDLLLRASEMSDGYFHKLAFNTLRQLGANFELCAAYLLWLDIVKYGPAAEAAQRISASAKAQQFMMARALARKKPFDLEALEPIAAAYDALFSMLEASAPLRAAE